MKRIGALITRLDRLEGVPEQITTLKLANEQNQAKIAQTKEETTATAKLLGESVASASEEVDRLKADLKQSIQALEDYKKQEATKEEAQKRHEQRQWRFHKSLKELFIKGAVLEDTVMLECFKFLFHSLRSLINFATNYPALRFAKNANLRLG